MVFFFHFLCYSLGLFFSYSISRGFYPKLELRIDQDVSDYESNFQRKPFSWVTRPSILYFRPLPGFLQLNVSRAVSLSTSTVNVLSSLQDWLHSVDTLPAEGISTAHALFSAQAVPPSRHHRHLHYLLNLSFLSNFYSGSGSPLPNVSI